MTETTSLFPGAYVADLHYGWQRVAENFYVSAVAEWDVNVEGGGDAHAFIAWLDTVAAMQKDGRRYSNKYLMIVATDPKLVAAWCYDGRHCGIVELRPK